MSRTSADRPTRAPFGRPRRKLDLKFRDTEATNKFHFHWAVESFVPSYLEEGYVFVDAKEAAVLYSSEVTGESITETRIRQRVGSDDDVTPKYAYLMKIPMDWWEEANRVRDAENQQVIDDLKRSPSGDSAELQVKQASFGRSN